MSAVACIVIGEPTANVIPLAGDVIDTVGFVVSTIPTYNNGSWVVSTSPSKYPCPFPSQTVEDTEALVSKSIEDIQRRRCRI